MLLLLLLVALLVAHPVLLLLGIMGEIRRVDCLRPG